MLLFFHFLESKLLKLIAILCRFYLDTNCNFYIMFDSAKSRGVYEIISGYDDTSQRGINIDLK